MEAAAVAAGAEPVEADDITTLPELLSNPHGSLPGIPSSDLARPAATDYLKTLTSLSLTALQGEPARIKDECSAIESELTNLCFREHRTFIEVHRCADNVQDALDGFGDSLDRLLEAVPPLEKECEAFAVSTKGIQQARRRATLVLEHQDKLLDLLEIPQLMDTCVRNGYYQEAMELHAHAAALAKRYGDVPIVLSVQAEVASVMHLQYAQLLAVLREPVKLPTLVKAVGFLRRMGRLPEDELRIAFLESRDFHFQAQLSGLDRDRSDKVRYTRRYVDLFRENIYDAISQYGSIFLDPALFAGQDEGVSAAAMDVLVIFCHRAVDDLLAVIDQTLPHIPDTSSLSSLLTQLGYCSLSFARVGLDFSHQLVRPFENAVYDLTAKGFQEAALSLTTTIKDATRLSRIPSTWMCASEHVSAITNSLPSPPNFPSLDTSPFVPPSFLTTYPPLAIYLNAALSTLNSLRLLAPQSLQQRLLEALDDSLAQVGEVFLAYARSVLQQTADAPTRPSRLRRNNSIGNQGISAEVRNERNTAAKRILCAFARAYLVGVVPHLRRALVVGVYAAESAPSSAESTSSTHAEMIRAIEAWVAEHQEAEAAAEAAEEEAPTPVLATASSAAPPAQDETLASIGLTEPALGDVDSSEENQSPINGRISTDLSLSQVSEAAGYDVDASAATIQAERAADDGHIQSPQTASDPAVPSKVQELSAAEAELPQPSAQVDAAEIPSANGANGQNEAAERTVEAESDLEPVGVTLSLPKEPVTDLSGGDATAAVMPAEAEQPSVRSVIEAVDLAAEVAEHEDRSAALAATEKGSSEGSAATAEVAVADGSPEAGRPNAESRPLDLPEEGSKQLDANLSQSDQVSKEAPKQAVEAIADPAEATEAEPAKVTAAQSSSDDPAAEEDATQLLEAQADQPAAGIAPEAPASQDVTSAAASAAQSRTPSEAGNDGPPSGTRTPLEDEDDAAEPDAAIEGSAATQPAKAGHPKGKNKKKKKKK